ncbi:MAG: type II toxin-antitoxin system VapC family toxin [bacterium]|nr:type II toxin-antitoxin system VapC family toxin [bacterium]MDE0287850.1 type II toxin-antitoxin system VapC family toxin [bacterium]MDE0438340.1 type II toxin-antitoxin system VapC family toxin [bacterium]
MNLLLDTHTALWWLNKDRLVAGAAEAIADPDNLVYVSVASIWEISIKQTIGKLTITDEFYTIVYEDFEPLHITISDARTAGSLPRHHRDPFDRMLVAQALARDLTLVSRDRALSRYGVKLMRA